ncbi:MAG: thioredoxin [Bacilli bacterium]|nr:thioredoxin [Bacilli bacterium]MBR4177790.1 thioredoxin [Bacilli bacterium]
MVKQIDTKEFKEVIKEGKVVVDLFATWCGPCKMLSPILDEISEEITTTKFFKIDVDDNQDVAREYNVMSIPTVLIFENGELINTIVGLRSREDLIEQFK